MSDSSGKPPHHRAAAKSGPDAVPEHNASAAHMPRPAHGAEPHEAPEDHWLCSELVTLEWIGEDGISRSQTVNLEEVWPRGAIADADQAVPAGATVTILAEPSLSEPTSDRPPADAAPSPVHSPSAVLHATAAECAERDGGYVLRLEFAPGVEWAPDQFPLSHAVNSRVLERKAAESSANTSPEAGDVAERAATDAAHRATDQALEQGSLFCLALQASRR